MEVMKGFSSIKKRERKEEVRKKQNAREAKERRIQKKIKNNLKKTV